jgi:hypothetical protein
MGARECWALRRRMVRRAERSFRGHSAGTLLGRRFGCTETVQRKVDGGCAARSVGAGSHGATHSGHRRHRLRVEIIGRRARTLWPRFTRARRRRCLRQLLALFHEPSCHQGSGGFLQPDIQELNDLLAKISGVAQSRQFVRLQRWTRSREQKIPRRLNFGMAVHGASCSGRPYVTTLVTSVKSYRGSQDCGKLWKKAAVPQRAGRRGRSPGWGSAAAAEPQSVATIRACSGCAGDYDDPDATAWTAGFGGNDEEDEPEPEEEFPASCN